MQKGFQDCFTAVGAGAFRMNSRTDASGIESADSGKSLRTKFRMQGASSVFVLQTADAVIARTDLSVAFVGGVVKDLEG